MRFAILIRFLRPFRSRSQMKRKLHVMGRQAIAKKVKKMCLKGEADRFIGNKMPKHLFSGKRGNGSNDRR